MNLPKTIPAWTDDEIRKVTEESLKEAEKAWLALEEEGIYTPEQLTRFAAQHPNRFPSLDKLIKKLESRASTL